MRKDSGSYYVFTEMCNCFTELRFGQVQTSPYIPLQRGTCNSSFKEGRANSPFEGRRIYAPQEHKSEGYLPRSTSNPQFKTF